MSSARQGHKIFVHQYHADAAGSLFDFGVFAAYPPQIPPEPSNLKLTAMTLQNIISNVYHVEYSTTWSNADLHTLKLNLADNSPSQAICECLLSLQWGRLGTCGRADNSLSANNTGYLCRQFRQRRLYSIPNHVEIDVEVTMGDAVAHSAHASPRYF